MVLFGDSELNLFIYTYILVYILKEAALREADGDELAKEVGNEEEKKLKKMEQIPSTKSGTASVFPVSFKPSPSDSFTDSTSEKDLVRRAHMCDNLMIQW